MSHYYEKLQWTAESKAYNRTSSVFNTLAFTLGAVGIMASIYIFVKAFEDNEIIGIVAALVLCFQSVMIIVFGMMMRSQANVVNALFEMGLTHTRQQIESSDDNA